MHARKRLSTERGLKCYSIAKVIGLILLLLLMLLSVQMHCVTLIQELCENKNEEMISDVSITYTKCINNSPKCANSCYFLHGINVIGHKVNIFGKIVIRCCK